MRRYVFALLLAASLAASPAMAADSRPPITQDIGRNFTTGAVFYFKTLGTWLEELLNSIGIKSRAALVSGALCQATTPCAPGSVCLNFCADGKCQRYEKRCVKGASKAEVLSEYAPCGGTDLCADGTSCTRLCPAGSTCQIDSFLCMKPVEPIGQCASDVECLSVCGQLTFPPIGPSALSASCIQNQCVCEARKTRPDAPRVACPQGMRIDLICPTGTHTACTPGDCATGTCPPMLTCLSAPSYGGECLEDKECSDADCAQGTTPFCAPDRHCKCQSQRAEPIACQTATDCSTVGCAANEVGACVSGVCACAPASAVACATVSDCSTNCPQGFSPACENSACLCQKTTTVPFACSTVQDCSQVSCPAGYDKGCRDSVCVCARVAPTP